MRKLETLARMFLVAALFPAAPSALAQNGFTNLHSFNFTDGLAPYAGVTLSGSILYGTTERGGSSGGAVVYRINTDGSQFTNIISFGGVAHTIAGVVSSGSSLFGATVNSGIIFALNTNGIGLTTLHDFDAGGGQNPEATLTLGGSSLYGTTSSGDNLFRVNTDSTGFTNLYSFSSPSGPHQTNSDGSETATVSSFGTLATYGSLILSGAALYGSAIGGGTGGSGALFRFNLAGSNFTTLYSFSAATLDRNLDGANPCGSMALSDNTLYGTTVTGGTNGNGAIFRINTDGSDFTNLHTFSQTENGTNSDGCYPLGGLLLSGSALYGTTHFGGTGAEGTVFKLNIDGTGFAALYSFSATFGGAATNADGANPMGALALSGGILYGAAQGGGLYGDGTVFALNASAPPVQLNIQSGSHAVVLIWNNPALFLQCAPMPQGGYTNVSGATSPFTNATSDSQAFFRLNSN